LQEKKRRWEDTAPSGRYQVVRANSQKVSNLRCTFCNNFEVEVKIEALIDQYPVSCGSQNYEKK